MAEGYRKPSLTPEAKAELTERERNARERERYAAAWRSHARFNRALRWYAVTSWVLPVVVFFMHGSRWVPGGLLLVGLAWFVPALYFRFRQFECPRPDCRGVWPFKRYDWWGGEWNMVGRWVDACPWCDLRVGDYPEPED